ncbi:hypothetical protein GCM10007416_32490 [Kroppenstedtia guangzhouensis]|uniref:Uncharacterized protein n=1 Tax=Kroppenstedtia guangzhouensis TaxID=1274356 RepID=A0ABQ1H2S9_9BACL|nr:hypothetical protein [Kroppenstedtia guangzhouensis]GGA56775.1 hypothetical protein GCM10007416_32490 [Kroppenstedtia guangzhouensis]
MDKFTADLLAYVLLKYQMRETGEILDVIEAYIDRGGSEEEARKYFVKFKSKSRQ